jgi:hypothetical protein
MRHFVNQITFNESATAIKRGSYTAMHEVFQKEFSASK